MPAFRTDADADKRRWPSFTAGTLFFAHTKHPRASEQQLEAWRQGDPRGVIELHARPL